MDELNLFLHYLYVLPDEMFSDPQVPFDKTSQHLQEAKWLKFRDQGIVRLQFLENFPYHYRDGLFIPAELLEHLSTF